MRRRLKRKKSRRVFKSGAKINKRNLHILPMRGGYRI